MKIKQALKKGISAGLSVVLALSPAITSYADGTAGNASGSDHGGVVTSSGGDFGVNVSPERLGRIGIRLSLVNADNPQEVISVTPDGKTRVVDILYVDKGTFEHYTSGDSAYLTPLTGDNMYSAVKTQSYTTKNSVYPVYYDQVAEYLGGDIQPWAEYHDNAYFSLGTEFTNWCVRNKDGVAVMGTDGKIKTTVAVDGTIIQITGANGTSNIQDVNTGNGYVRHDDARKTYSDFARCYEKNGTNLFVSPGGMFNTEQYAYELQALTLSREKGYLTDEDYITLKGRLDSIRQAAYEKYGTEKKETILSSIKGLFFPEPMIAYAAEGENVAEGGTVKDAHINELLKMSVGGVPLLQTRSMIEEGNTDIAKAKENWCLLVEPIVYLTIFKTGNDRQYHITKQYGTISNIAEALHDKVGGSVTSRSTFGFFNWKAINMLWSALHVTTSTDENNNVVNGFKFNEHYMLTVPDANQLGKYVSFDTLADWNTWKDNGSGVQQKVGYGVNVYWPGQFKSGIDTWDSETYPNAFPGPAPDASDPTKYPPESSYGKDSKKFQITKWYVIEREGGKQEVFDVVTRKNTPHVVNVLNEGDLESDYYWYVEKWGTSLSTEAPEDGDTSTTFEDYWSRNKGTQSDTKPAIVTIKPNDPDKSIYVKLVLKVLPKKKVDIVRVYETPNQPPVIEVAHNVKVENNVVDGSSPKPGFTYVENVNTSEPRKDITTWEDVPEGGTGGRNPQIPVADTDKTIYIKYEEQVEGDPQATGLVLHENEISHQFTLSDVTGSLVEGVQNWSSVSSDASCPYSWTCSDDDCDGHTCGSSYDYTGSEDWSFGIENHPNYNTQFVYKWIQLEPKHWTGGGLSESGGSGSGTPNMNMILQRSISDKVTLYPSKNSNKAALNDMGITSEGYIPANTRKDGLKDVPSRKSWNETFNTNFEFVNVNEPTAYFESDHGYTDTDNHTDDGNNASSLNGTYSKSGNTTIYGLWGKENKGDRALTDTAQQNIWKLSTLNFKGFKNHIKEQSFTFYPYYKMKFVSELDGSEQDAYLTAENLSTLFSLQRIDTSIFRPKGATTLELTSSQWSTHAKAHNLLDAAGVENKNSLLPAGAIYDLRTAGNGVKASQSWVGYRVFNSYVMDKNALADATNVKTKQEVVDAVNAFKNDTKNVLSNYEVVMVGQEGINPDDNNGEFYRGSEVITGKDGSYRLGQEFIRDSKYDLQTTGSASGNSSDIDVLEELEETYDWVLTSDADGNVVITRNGTELERLQKNQKNLTNAEVKEFDSRTNIVTNFLSAIDRNMGSDRNGKTWYNEGFSIGCLETRLAYRMGFGDGDASLRSTALNIKANGKLENRNDMFNGDEAKNRSYQFFTSARSTLNGCEKDYVGTYDGIKIFIPNMNQLLVSNRFYTSNTTVMDLN